MIPSKIINGLILLLVFLLPLVPSYFGKGYEEIKVLTLLYGTIGVIFLISTQFMFKRAKVMIPKLIWIMIILIIILLITSTTGLNSTQSILGGAPYFQGWVTYLFLAVLAIAVIIQNINSSNIIKTIIYSSSIVSLTALTQYFMLQQGLFVPTYAGRVISTFGQPNFYAGFLLFTLPFLLDQISRARRNEKILLLVTFALNCAAIAISFSRSAIILAAILISLWLILKLTKTKITKFLLIVILISGLFYAIYNARLIQHELIQPIISQRVENSNAQRRIYIWQVAIEQVRNRPLQGYGLENINLAFPKTYDFNHPKPAFYHSIKDLAIDNTHNIFLNLLMWGGIVACLTFCYLYYEMYRSTNNSTNKIFLIIFILWSIVQNLSIIHLVLFFLMIAVIVNETRQSIDTVKTKKVQLMKPEK